MITQQLKIVLESTNQKFQFIKKQGKLDILKQQQKDKILKEEERQNGKIHKRQESTQKYIIFQKRKSFISITLLIIQKDIYYRKAKEDCFRARSAYKLLQIDEVFGIFENAERVIDLCAAPGSWSQVVAKKLTEKGLFLKVQNPLIQNKLKNNLILTYKWEDLKLFNDYQSVQKDENGEDVRIISIDLQEMAPIDNVVQLQGDITKKETVDEILNKFKGNRADLVVDDGAPDVTGFHDIDQYLQSQLMVAALNICNGTLKKGGHFVAKIFKGTDIKFLYSQFKLFFKSVYVVKPKSSRASSVENFLVCLTYDPPQSYENSTTKSLYTFQPEIEKIQEINESISQQTKQDQKYYKFVTCGDLSGFDEETD